MHEAGLTDGGLADAADRLCRLYLPKPLVSFSRPKEPLFQPEPEPSLDVDVNPSALDDAEGEAEPTRRVEFPDMFRVKTELSRPEDLPFRVESIERARAAQALRKSPPRASELQGLPDSQDLEEEPLPNLVLLEEEDGAEASLEGQGSEATQIQAPPSAPTDDSERPQRKSSGLFKKLFGKKDT